MRSCRYFLWRFRLSSDSRDSLLCIRIRPFRQSRRGWRIRHPLPLWSPFPVCLAPTTIGALLSAIGIAGMSRLNQANVLAMSGRATEAAGDVDILMLDKNRHDYPSETVRRMISFRLMVPRNRNRQTRHSFPSLADETPEGRSVVILAKEKVYPRTQPVG